MIRLIFLSLLLSACGGDSTSPTPPQPVRVAILGDSLMAQPGWCLEGWPGACGISNGDQIGQMLYNADVVNMAVPSETTDDRLNKDAPIGFDFVMLRYGAADIVHLQNISQTVSNLSRMIGQLRAGGQNPVLIGVSPLPMWEPADELLNNELVTLAIMHEIPFIDVRVIEYGPGDIPDLIHPATDFADRQNRYIADQMNLIILAAK